MAWIRRTITDDRKVFHSFRHSLTDFCRAAGIPKELHFAITGHRDSDVGSSYGNGFTIAALAEAVARLSFPVPLHAKMA